LFHQVCAWNPMLAGSTPRSYTWQRPEVQGDGAMSRLSMIRSPLRRPASDDSNARSRSRMPADMRSCIRVVELAPSASTVMTRSSSRLTTSTAPCCCFIEGLTGTRFIGLSSSVHANAIADARRRSKDLAQTAVAGPRNGDAEQVVAAAVGIGSVFVDRAREQRDVHADHVIPVGDVVGGAVLVDDDVAVGVDAVLHLELLDAFDQLFRSVQPTAAPQ